MRADQERSVLDGTRAATPGAALVVFALLLALLSLSLFAQPAFAVPNGLISADTRIDGREVTVVAEDAPRAEEVLRLAENGWAQVEPLFRTSPPEQVIIFVLVDSEYDSIQPAPMTRGFATYGGHRIYLKSSSTDQEVVTHELTHIFLGHEVRSGLDVPDWFNEGLAQYVSGARAPTLQLIYEMSSGNMLSLQELGKVDALHDGNRQIASVEGLAIVQFLVQDFGEARLWRLLGQLSEASSFDEALASTYGYSNLELSQRWMAYADDAYSLFSPVALRAYVTLVIGGLALIGAAIWLIRRTQLIYAGEDRLREEEVVAARAAENYIRMAERSSAAAVSAEQRRLNAYPEERRELPPGEQE
ncbi:MAG TPA: peptidase MA family metallohydrolase [Thermoleophilia bacterium]|nr:peptidase MA family metallohydrolase [Thermoleophilia bacterium]